MNLYSTWTSRRQQMTENCSRLNHKRPTLGGSRLTLRSEQKTSGLFDTVQAGNETVAGKASKAAPTDVMDPGMKACPDNSLSALTLSEDLGPILPDMEFELMEGDYMDSFMDLSNFLLQEDSKSAVGGAVDIDVLKGKLDFSGIVDHLDTEATVPMEVPAYPQPFNSATSPRKRKRINYAEMSADVVDGSNTTLGPECMVADHDYITKRPKLAAVACDAPAAADVITTCAANTKRATSTVPREAKKYRERRDKNNVASRRSRQIRKHKFIEMDKEAEELEQRNDELRNKIVELEALAKTMKATLIKKMTDK